MKYMGSKRRIAKDILPIILKNRMPEQFYVEPFCGGCNMIELVEGNRIANDYNEYVAEMWSALVNRNWQPPTEITEEQYKDIKANKEQDPEKEVMIQQGEEYDYMKVYTVKVIELWTEENEQDETIEAVVIEYS